MSARSPQDWEALKRAEQKGRELPGTFERLWKEDQERIAAERKRQMDADFAQALKLHDEMKKARR